MEISTQKSHLHKTEFDKQSNPINSSIDLTEIEMTGMILVSLVKKNHIALPQKLDSLLVYARVGSFGSTARDFAIFC